MTDPARQVVAHARRWSRNLGHRRLGTEHLVGGLVELAEASPPPGDLLIAAGIGRGQVHAALLQLRRDDAVDLGVGMLLFTRRAAAVLRATPRIADAHGHTMVTAEHVLAAVVADRACRGAQLLGDVGVDLDALAAQLAVPTIAQTQRPDSDSA